MLLIVTNRHELAADYLLIRAGERRIPVRRFNTETLGATTDLEISFSNAGVEFCLTLEDGLQVRRADITGVYFHHPMPPSATVPVPAEHQDFADDELLELLRSLWRLIPDEYWLNHPLKLYRAENKVDQLAVAARCGFLIPDTLISRSRHSITDFLRSHSGHAVTKAVRHGFVVRDDGVLLAGTQRIDKSFSDLLPRYAAVPAVYQTAISKRYDVRVVAVDNVLFSVAITTPSDVPDWRLAELQGEPLTYEIIELPSHVRRACLDVLRVFGLRYSSMDLIQASDGSFVFLELNPSGQWAWLEQITGCPISDALLDALGFSHARG